jgi:oligoribonuclease NrnB/cAMP/cGMP phosphodiesterase (DHH superfamily)
MKVFYHNDNDGKCSAFLIGINFPKIKDIEYIEMDYSKPFPINTIKPIETVFIVDYHITPDEMTLLLEITKNVIWIDHHITSIEKYKNKKFNHEIKGVQISGISACELTYLYFSCKSTNYQKDLENAKNLSGKLCPWYVKLIGDRDVWNFKYGEWTGLFHLWLGTFDLTPNSQDWLTVIKEASCDMVCASPIPEIAENIEKWRNNFAKDYKKSYGYEFEFEGLKCFGLNLGQCGSEYFGDFINKYDALVPHAFNGEKWIVSMYTGKDIDLSKIALKYGGGGHKKACGFNCKELPWKI